MQKQIFVSALIMAFALFALSPIISAKMDDGGSMKGIAAQRAIYLPLVNRNSHQCTPEKINLCPKRLQKILLYIRNQGGVFFLIRCMDTYLMCVVEFDKYLRNPPVGISPMRPIEPIELITERQIEFAIPDEKSAIYLYFWKPESLIFHNFYDPPW